MAVHGDEVFARLEPRGVVDCNGYIIGIVSLQAGDAIAVDEYFRIFVVVDAQLQVVELFIGDCNLAAEPNIGRVPSGVDVRTGSAGSTEAPFAVLPRGIVEVA